ncbi:MAG: hypothetical protein MI863_14920 [Desulfobacterales bacterium]|nr:hypothetical protein [Desulfobacterales bacterium]
MKQAPPSTNGITAMVSELTGFSDSEMARFMKQPRTRKILGRLEAIGRIAVIFEVSRSHGCVAGHKAGDFYLFPNGGAMDLKNSTPRLCPFLMPPMTRMMWILQERVWEGLDPLPLYAAGHCDDVGLDCNGWGRVIIEARIMTPEEAADRLKQG